MPRQDVYVSIDIEADGPAPGLNSMLSLGAAAFVLPSRTPIATYEVNLKPLEGASQNADTMEWWKKFPEAWDYVTSNQREPSEAIPEFKAWAQNLKTHGSPVMVTYPTWDYMWVEWYMLKFGDGWKTPFGIGSLDIKSLAMAVLKNDRFKETSKRKMPKRWFEGAPPHTHKALDDAHGQGVMLVNILCEHLGLTPE